MKKDYKFLFLLSFVLFACPSFAEDILVAFSPQRGATQAVVDLISQAHLSIDLAAYSFTSSDVAKALLAAQKKGIKVRVVLDKSNVTARYTAATFLANEHVPVRIDYKYAIMHNKYMIIDGKTVETGSFNYTKAAELNNAENVIIISDNPSLAGQYEKDWTRLWNESESYQRH